MTGYTLFSLLTYPVTYGSPRKTLMSPSATLHQAATCCPTHCKQTVTSSAEAVIEWKKLSECLTARQPILGEEHRVKALA